MLGALVSAAVNGACESENAMPASRESNGASSEPNGMGVVPPAGATVPGTPGPSGSTRPGTPPSGTSGEGPPVTAGLNGGPAPQATPAGGPTPAGNPVLPPPGTSVTPGATEPTDCVIPPVIATPVGYGSATTGGGNATAVVVNTYDAAQAALDDYRDAFKDGTQTAFVLRYTGSFDYSTITDVCAQHTKAEQILEIKEIENVTILGAPGSSANFGLKVSRAKNVIIRNMTLGLLPGGGSSDAITLEGNDTNGDVENVWVDHNDLFSSTKDDCEGAGDTEFDGLIDIKKGARRITVSYNYLHDHQKTGLLGSSDDDQTERYVTFHHNRYENVVSRTPLHRFGYIHAFNNYYGTITSSGINVRMGGIALIESNFFENALNPVTSRYSPEVGLWDLRNNHVGPGVTWDVEEDTLANADTWQSTTTFPASELNYSYTPDRAGCVKQIVFAQAGAKL
jgi:pectate lyase